MGYEMALNEIENPVKNLRYRKKTTIPSSTVKIEKESVHIANR